MPYKNYRPCSVEACDGNVVGLNLCEKHYRRFKRHGRTDNPRPKGWGQRSSHPMKDRWSWTKKPKEGRVKEWDDFWQFVEDVGEPPSKHHRLKRINTKEPFGPDNFWWQEYKPCDARKNSASYQKWLRNRDPRAEKNRNLKRQYGITIDDYERMSDEQGGVCKICGQEDEHWSLAVDHCHDTNKIRGLLCSQCNRGLGLFKDDAARLASAIVYLRENK